MNKTLDSLIQNALATHAAFVDRLETLLSRHTKKNGDIDFFFYHTLPGENIRTHMKLHAYATAMKGIIPYRSASLILQCADVDQAKRFLTLINDQTLAADMRKQFSFTIIGERTIERIKVMFV